MIKIRVFMVLFILILSLSSSSKRVNVGNNR